MSNQEQAFSSTERKLGACSYLLHGLLQRLEQDRPGLLDSFIAGVEADRGAMSSQDTPGSAVGREIADEALKMLRLMKAQLQGS